MVSVTTRSSLDQAQLVGLQFTGTCWAQRQQQQQQRWSMEIFMAALKALIADAACLAS
jgi:hypothetical protein